MDTNTSAHVKLGWLWFDNDPRTSLEDKVLQAAEKYKQKFGRQPRVCYVNAKVLPETPAESRRVKIEGANNVLPGHFLFVLDEELAAHRS